MLMVDMFHLVRHHEEFLDSKQNVYRIAVHEENEQTVHFENLSDIIGINLNIY